MREEEEVGKCPGLKGPGADKSRPPCSLTLLPMRPWAGKSRRRAHSACEWREKHFAPAVAAAAAVTLQAFDFLPSAPTSTLPVNDVALAYRLNPNGLDEFLSLRPVVPLYAHQASGADFILGRYRQALGGAFCDDMRTGKTRAALFAMITAQQEATAAASAGQGAAGRWGRPSLVVCPKDVLPVWQEELETLYGPEGRRRLAVLTLETETIQARESRATLLARLREGTDLVLVSASYLAESTHFGAAVLRGEIAFRLLLCDEAHEYISPGSTRSVEALSRVRADSKWYLTGTPLQNSLQSLTTALGFMGVHRSRLNGLSAKALIALARSMTLRRTWNLLEVMPRTPVPTVRFLEERVYRAALTQLLGPPPQVRPPGFKPLTIIHTLRQLVLTTYMCRDLYTTGVLKLPEGVCLAPEDVDEGGGGGGAFYDDLGKLTMALAVREMTLEDIGADPRLAWKLVPPEWRTEQPLVCDHLRRQVDALKATLVSRVAPKERWFIHVLLRGRLEQTGEKVVLFSGFRAPLQRLAKLLQMRREFGVPNACNFVYVDGDFTAADRKRERDRFFSDPTCQVLLATIDVNSRGLDLTHANHAVINDPWWNPTDEHQATGRIKGPKQTRPVCLYRLILPGTIDECVADEADAKVRLDQAALPQTLLGKEEGGGPVEVPAVATEDASEEAVRERVRTNNVMDKLRAQLRTF
jgi:hypothetical protein